MPLASVNSRRMKPEFLYAYLIDVNRIDRGKREGRIFRASSPSICLGKGFIQPALLSSAVILALAKSSKALVEEPGDPCLFPSDHPPPLLRVISLAAQTSSASPAELASREITLRAENFQNLKAISKRTPAEHRTFQRFTFPHVQIVATQATFGSRDETVPRGTICAAAEKWKEVIGDCVIFQGALYGRPITRQLSSLKYRLDPFVICWGAGSGRKRTAAISSAMISYPLSLR